MTVISPIVHNLPVRWVPSRTPSRLRRCSIHVSSAGGGAGWGGWLMAVAG